MTNREKELYKLTESPDDNIANKAMKELREINPTWHFCCEWDYLAICDEDDAYEHCLCELWGAGTPKSERE